MSMGVTARMDGSLGDEARGAAARGKQEAQEGNTRTAQKVAG
jgi:hypothetical protein